MTNLIGLHRKVSSNLRSKMVAKVWKKPNNEHVPVEVVNLAIILRRSIRTPCLTASPDQEFPARRSFPDRRGPRQHYDFQRGLIFGENSALVSSQRTSNSSSDDVPLVEFHLIFLASLCSKKLTEKDELKAPIEGGYFQILIFFQRRQSKSRVRVEISGEGPRLQKYQPRWKFNFNEVSYSEAVRRIRQSTCLSHKSLLYKPEKIQSEYVPRKRQLSIL